MRYRCFIVCIKEDLILFQQDPSSPASATLAPATQAPAPTGSRGHGREHKGLKMV